MAEVASNVRVSETPEALAERVAGDFETMVQETLAGASRVTVALAGGQTPKTLYERLAQEPYRSRIPWDKLWFYWGDERCVPPEHPDSNFRMVNEALLCHVNVRPSQVFRMRGEDPPPQAARDYEDLLKKVFPNEPWPIFDLILLGLGPDGHTASLMPNTPALQTAGSDSRWVVGNVIRSMQTVRITFTLPALNHARRVWFLVTGGKKAAVFAKVQASASVETPASLVRPVSGQLRWYVDHAVTTVG